MHWRRLEPPELTAGRRLRSDGFKHEQDLLLIWLQKRRRTAGGSELLQAKCCNWRIAGSSGLTTVYKRETLIRGVRVRIRKENTGPNFVLWPPATFFSRIVSVLSCAGCYSWQISAQTASWQWEMWHKVAEHHVSTNCNHYNRWLILLLPLMTARGSSPCRLLTTDTGWKRIHQLTTNSPFLWSA